MTFSKALIVAVFLAGLIYVLEGCKARVQVEQWPVTPTYEEIVSLLASATITIGDHSYIKVDRKGTPSEYAAFLLGIVQAFALQHPELDVTSFDIENLQPSYATTPFIFGLWIHHHPRSSEQTAEK